MAMRNERKKQEPCPCLLDDIAADFKNISLNPLVRGGGPPSCRQFLLQSSSICVHLWLKSFSTAGFRLKRFKNYCDHWKRWRLPADAAHLGLRREAQRHAAFARTKVSLFPINFARSKTVSRRQPCHRCPRLPLSNQHHKNGRAFIYFAPG